jgi:hypothetical protein
MGANLVGKFLEHIDSITDEQLIRGMHRPGLHSSLPMVGRVTPRVRHNVLGSKGHTPVRGVCQRQSKQYRLFARREERVL